MILKNIHKKIFLHIWSFIKIRERNVNGIIWDVKEDDKELTRRVDNKRVSVKRNVRPNTVYFTSILILNLHHHITILIFMV